MSRVVVMFRPTRKSVVNSSMVGNTENCSGVFTYIDIISMRNEIVRFMPISVSTMGVGSGMIISVITRTSSATIVMSLCRVIALTMRVALSCSAMG